CLPLSCRSHPHLRSFPTRPLPISTRTDKTIKYGWLGVKRIVLSGTSITQGLEDLYTQYKFLDPEIIGLDSYYTFRARYCVTIPVDRKSTRLNSSHVKISYAVFCLQ